MAALADEEQIRPRSTHITRRQWIAAGVFALIAICLNPFNIHTLPLVQFEYFYILLAIVYLLIYDDLLHKRKSPAFFLTATLFMFFFGDAQGVVEERHRALNWLVCFQNDDWDNVDTPT